MAANWASLVSYAEWATQGRRLFVTLAVVVTVVSWIGMKVRGGAGFRGYVVMALLSPFIVLGPARNAWRHPRTRVPESALQTGPLP